jgi:DNA ligase (NAD+)
MTEQDPRSMDEADARAEFEALQTQIEKADLDYHQKDAPTLSDAEYDRLKRRYLALADAFPILAKDGTRVESVGAPAASGFGKVTHAQRMMSLGNAFEDQDVEDFAAGLRRYLGLSSEAPLAFTAEPKIDGLSLSLRYEAGKLVQAATRGDGAVG